MGKIEKLEIDTPDLSMIEARLTIQLWEAIEELQDKTNEVIEELNRRGRDK